MYRKIAELYMIIALFCFLIIGKECKEYTEIILNFSFVIILVLLQIIKNIFNLNNIIISIIQGGCIILFKVQGAFAIELFLPLILFEIVEFNSMNIIITLVFSAYAFLFFNFDIVNYAIYIILCNLYIYSSFKQFKDSKELKDLNKVYSSEKNILRDKVLYMDKYIEQQNIVTSLKERNYMAQKIHDHLGHRITSSLMQLEVTKETLGKDNDISMKYLKTAMEGLRTGMEEIRSFLRDAKPDLKVITIEDIKKELLEFQFSTNIKTHIIINGEIEKIDSLIINVIYDNIKESLTNTSKYSNASNVYLSLNIYNKFIRIEIRDDGFGCEKIIKGLGLKGMEERIEKVGGNIQFYNDKGFVINMIINIGGNYEN